MSSRFERDWHQAWPPLPASVGSSATSGVTREPRVLVLDDDRMFTEILAWEARARHVELTVCHSVDELTKLPAEYHADVAIVDYFLHQSTTGVAAAHLLEDDVPVVLISNMPSVLRGRDESWPRSIRRCLAKGLGHGAILQESLAAVAAPLERRAADYLWKKAAYATLAALTVVGAWFFFLASRLS